MRPTFTDYVFKRDVKRIEKDKVLKIQFFNVLK